MIPGSQKDHPSFARSFGFAIEGFVTAVRTERNIKVMLFMAAAALIACGVLRVDALSWAIVVGCCGTVISAELLNTSIEAVVDLACPRIDPMAKRAKDIAAASVHTVAIASALIGLVVFARALGLLA